MDTVVITINYLTNRMLIIIVLLYQNMMLNLESLGFSVPKDFLNNPEYHQMNFKKWPEISKFLTKETRFAKLTEFVSLLKKVSSGLSPLLAVTIESTPSCKMFMFVRKRVC